MLLVDQSQEAAEGTLKMIAEEGGEAAVLVADVTRARDCQAMVDEAVTRWGRLDILDNNVGIGGRGTVVEVKEEEWERIMRVNVTGMMLASKHAIPAMAKGGGGAIVNISSMAGRRGLAYRVGYCAAKAGQVGMTYGLALELGRHNITVNAVLPGAVAGDRIDRVIAGQAEMRGVSVEQQRKSFIDRAPLKRMATAEDIANAVVFLCSDAARSISGQCLPVNAGEPAS